MCIPPTTVSKAPTDLENQTPSQEGTLENNPPPLENIPVHAGTPWPEAGKMSGNLFELRKDWQIPPNNNDNTTATASIPKPPIKIEHQDEEQPITQFNSSTEIRKVWVGTKLLHLQEHEGRLGW